MENFASPTTPAAMQQVQGQPNGMVGNGLPDGMNLPEFIAGEQAFQENEVVRSVLFSRLAQLRPEMAAKLDAAVTIDNLDVFLALLPELAPVLSEVSALDGYDEQEPQMGAGMQAPPGGAPAAMPQQPGMPPMANSSLARQRFGG